MANKILVLFSISFLFSFCTNTPKLESPEFEFDESTTILEQPFITLRQSFQGQLVTDPVDGFSGKNLVMHVLSCDDNRILVPFNVGENRSRTWIFTKKNNRIELKHDHRMEDGSDDEITMYGGTSTNAGTANMQLFPADQETQDNIPYAFSNVWWVTVNDSVYSYNLRRIGRSSVFTVEFDLTQEVVTPEPSWGWENFGN